MSKKKLKAATIKKSNVYLVTPKSIEGIIKELFKKHENRKII